MAAGTRNRRDVSRRFRLLWRLRSVLGTVGMRGEGCGGAVEPFLPLRGLWEHCVPRERPSGGVWGVALRWPPVLPARSRPQERQELLHQGGLFTLPSGWMSGVFSLQNSGRIWRKKEPDAPCRLNKAYSGRAAACGPREPDGTAGAEAGSSATGGAGPGPQGGDGEGTLCSCGTRAATFNERGPHTCIEARILPSPTR